MRHDAAKEASAITTRASATGWLSGWPVSDSDEQAEAVSIKSEGR